MERFQNFVPIGGAQSHYFVFIDQQRSIYLFYSSAEISVLIIILIRRVDYFSLLNDPSYNLVNL
jgi:hypothetical protein